MTKIARYANLGTSAAVAPPRGTPYPEDVFGVALYTGTGAAQAVQSSIAAGTAGPSTTWLANLGGSADDKLLATCVDSSGNIYVGGTQASQGVGNSDALIASYTSAGVLRWQRYLGGATNNEFIQGMVCDSSSNLYVVGYTGSQGAGSLDILIAKYNSSGAIQWQRRIGGTNADIGQAIAIDNTNSMVYITCRQASDTTGSYDLTLIKYNFSGTLQWQKALGGTAVDVGYGCAVDSSGAIFATGSQASQTLGSNEILLAKYTSAGAVTWQRRLSGTGDDNSMAACTDGTSYYVAGYEASQGAGSTDLFLAKYDNTGAIQWQRRLGGSVTDIINACACDSSGNIYIAGYQNSQTSGTNDGIIAKYNSSGVIQWQRRIGGAGDTQISGISVAPGGGSYYIAGFQNNQGSGNYDAFTASLPTDGTGTGTWFGNMVYQASTLTEAAMTLTDAATTLTERTPVLTEAAATLTDAALTLTNTVYNSSTLAGDMLVWLKSRGASGSHALYDTKRGVQQDMMTDSSNGQTTQAQGVTNFAPFGVTIGTLAKINTNAATYGGLMFVKAAKFFDVVTFTSGSSTNRRISHSLGVIPGCIIVKAYATTGSWWVYHRGTVTPRDSRLLLDTNQPSAFVTNRWGSSDPTTTDFGMDETQFGSSGVTYVAYLFAHDVGWTPQAVLMKASDKVDAWVWEDTTRGLWATGDASYASKQIDPSSSGAEASGNKGYITPSGMAGNTSVAIGVASANIIYVAIRSRQRVPTSGIQVFKAITRTGTGAAAIVSGVGFDPDLVISKSRSSTTAPVWADRVKGPNAQLYSSGNAARSLITTDITGFDIQDGLRLGTSSGGTVNTNAVTYVYWCFKRWAKVFDIVVHKSDNTNSQVVNHNLQVQPELIFMKNYDGTGNWIVDQRIATNSWLQSSAAGGFVINNATTTAASGNAYDTYMTALTFQPGRLGGGNETSTGSGVTFVSYLFATLAGISKVGTYVGNGASLNVECGFSTGARFIMVRRYDNSISSNWYIWDTVRGVVASGNDPWLNLGATSVETTTDSSVEPYSPGFAVVQNGTTNVNVNGGLYIFLALA